MLATFTKAVFVALPLLILGMAAAPPDDWLRRGNAAFERGDYATALECYAQAVPLAADPGMVAFDQAAAYYRLELFGEAEAAYRRCLEDAAGPRRLRALYGLANAQAQMGRERLGRSAVAKLSEAVKNYKTCIQEAPNDAEGQETAANARHNLSIVEPLLAQKAADPANDDGRSGPNNPREDPSRPRNTGDGPGTPGDQGQSPSGPRGTPGPNTPVPPDGQPQPSDQAQPGKGNLPPLLDDKNAPPLDANQAADYLQRNLDRIRRDQANRQPPTAGSRKGVRDW